jgi:UDP-N-acetylglucosamine--N-acetylmuramyl-(pentapeptide) pyrophosphoryl-undecaprenol N-acetylglucosamine transferase
MHTIVFAGGGSGGHLFPAIAVARELLHRRPDARIVFVGGRRPVDGDILSREPFERRELEAATSAELARQPLRSIRRSWRSMQTATGWLQEWRPRVVIGCGGYVSVPVALAARRGRTPLVLLEQNVIPGRATSWLARRASAVCTSFDATAEYLPRGARVVVTGNPVRAEIAALATTLSSPAAEPRSLLVLGGSQGAASVNRMLLESAARHRGEFKGWRIVHQTGARDEGPVRERYRELSLPAEVSPFLIDMAGAYALADVAVSRAGATTLAELACAGLPAVLIPYPGAVRDHQQRNAEAYARSGAAQVVQDGADDHLASALLPLLGDADRRLRMAERMRACARPSAAQRVADTVLEACGE